MNNDSPVEHLAGVPAPDMIWLVLVGGEILWEDGTSGGPEDGMEAVPYVRHAASRPPIADDLKAIVERLSRKVLRPEYQDGKDTGRWNEELVNPDGPDAVETLRGAAAETAFWKKRAELSGGLVYEAWQRAARFEAALRGIHGRFTTRSGNDPLPVPIPEITALVDEALNGSEA